MSATKPEKGDKFRRDWDGLDWTVTGVGGYNFLAVPPTGYLGDETKYLIKSWGQGHHWIDPNAPFVADQWGYLDNRGFFISCFIERDARPAAARNNQRTLARIIGGVVHIEKDAIGKPPLGHWVPVKANQ